LGTITVAAVAAVPIAVAPAAGVLPAVKCVAGLTCHGKPKCANQDAEPTGDNVVQIRRATLCLLNRQRTKHGLGKLHANRSLHGVAQRYAHKMVVDSFFDHVAPSGSTFVDRIKHSKYLHGVRGWSLGENLAWGASVLSTPKKIVLAWMASPGHRANILNGTYRDIGVGVAPGIPLVGGGVGATYVNEFGQRTR
jgi:uncharacterized protein YkwD